MFIVIIYLCVRFNMPTNYNVCTYIDLLDFLSNMKNTPEDYCAVRKRFADIGYLETTENKMKGWAEDSNFWLIEHKIKITDNYT